MSSVMLGRAWPSCREAWDRVDPGPNQVACEFVRTVVSKLVGVVKTPENKPAAPEP